jgi:hypothetical protein
VPLPARISGAVESNHGFHIGSHKRNRRSDCRTYGDGNTDSSSRHAGQTQDMLTQHAHHASLLAIAAGGIKAEWLSFANQAPAQLGPTARAIVSLIGRIRSNLIAETDQVAAILRNIDAAASTLRNLQALLSHLRFVGGIMPPEENEAITNTAICTT